MIITSVHQLSDLLNLVHDRWFNVERVTLDKERKTVVMVLEVSQRQLTKSSENGITMLINNAEELTINDTERVRDYDLNDITYDVDNSRLLITGGIPITIEVKVATLNIEVIVNR